MKKDINRRMKLLTVSIFTANILTDKSGEKYDFDTFKIKLLNNGDEVIYNVLVAFKESEYNSVYKEVLGNNLKDINDFSLDGDITLISLYEDKYSKFDQISFDDSDDCPIKSMLDVNSTENAFFNKFMNFRNNLISNGQVVKSDDIYQYYMSITGNFGPKATGKPKIRSKFRSFFVKN